MFAALATILASILAFDLKLRDGYLQANKVSLNEYQKASRFNDYEQANVKNFTDLDLKAANNLGVLIEYGEKETVWIRKADKDMMSVSQNGVQLAIDLSEKGKARNYLREDYCMIIISPKINRIDLHAIGQVKKYKELNGDSAVTTMYYNAKCNVERLRNDSLTINLAANTHLNLSGNRIQTLTATVGDESGNGNLTFNYGNSIDEVFLDVKNASSVSVNDSGIRDIQYKISNTAIVTLRGTELNKILKK